MVQTSRLSGLSTLRTAAILAVMLYHTAGLQPAALEGLAHTGWMGVDLFFVLSGYLIGLQLLRSITLGRQLELGAFYRRRAFRILPAYLAVLTLYRFWPLWRGASRMSPLWEFLTCTENLFVHYASDQAFSHVWSLCIEEHFYLVLPFILLAITRRPSACKTIALFAGVLLFGVVVRTWLLVHTLHSVPVDSDAWSVLYIERIYYPTWTRLDGLLAGVGLATLELLRPAWWRQTMRRGHALLAAGMTLIALAVRMFWRRFDSDTGLEAWATAIGFPVLSLGLALVVASAVSRNGPLARARIPGAETLATLAYSLYLTHKEVIRVTRLLLPQWTAPATWYADAVYAAACLAVAALLYLLVERPFLLLRDRFGHRTARPETLTDPAI